MHGCFQSLALSTFLQVVQGVPSEQGFFSIRHRMHAPLLRTSCTSFRRESVNRPRTFGLADLGSGLGSAGWGEPGDPGLMASLRRWVARFAEWSPLGGERGSVPWSKGSRDQSPLCCGEDKGLSWEEPLSIGSASGAGPPLGVKSSLAAEAANCNGDGTA